ncbi:hypothetical protein K1719_013295 [Acacia pycnantha]|nr:hypothetical protein K1719_013295 [Acacia pycnantha]
MDPIDESVPGRRRNYYVTSTVSDSKLENSESKSEPGGTIFVKHGFTSLRSLLHPPTLHPLSSSIIIYRSLQSPVIQYIPVAFSYFLLQSLLSTYQSGVLQVFANKI